MAQTALVVHRIDHGTAEHRASCALCIAADHAAAPTPEPLRPLVPEKPAPVVFDAVGSAPVVLTLAYHSRAPPAAFQS